MFKSMRARALPTCDDCLALKATYVQAVKERGLLEEMQVEAVLSGRAFALDNELKLAQTRESRAASAMLCHSCDRKTAAQQVSAAKPEPRRRSKSAAPPAPNPVREAKVQ